MRPACLFSAMTLLALGAGSSVQAQVSLGTVVDLALRSSPKVQIAKADYEKARGSLAEARGAYVPQVNTNGGYGKSTGAPLSVPIIFSIGSESLVFSFAQRDYIRAAHSSVDATQHALVEAEIEVSEDASNTYLALDNAQQRQAIVQDEQEIARNLVDVVGDRVTAGVDARVESIKARRTQVQLHLQFLHIEDEIAGYTTHLTQLTGLPATGLITDRNSIPQLTKPVDVPQATEAVADSEGVKAAFAVADAKQHTAFGDHRYLLRPQIMLQAQYSRVDTGLSSYLAYYPRFSGTPATDGMPARPNSQNALGFGLTINLPLLDMTHRAKARQSAAEAARALAEARQQRALFLEGRAKLRNATLELDARADLAELDHEMAQDQLDTLHIQLQASSSSSQSGTQVNPKDELNARLNERQKSYDLLNSQLQLHQTQINLLRQQGGLGDWIHETIGTPTAAPSIPVSGPQTNAPGVPGALPVSTGPTTLPTAPNTTLPHP